MEHLEKVSEAVSPTGKRAPWSWRSERVSVSTEDPGKDIRDYLSEHCETGLAIARQNHENSYACLTLITQYDEGEMPRGIFLSSDTIALLSEYRLAFDLDVVQLI